MQDARQEIKENKVVSFKIEDLLQDEVFKNELSKIVTEIIRKRNVRPEPPTGMKYRRDWVDRLQSENRLNSYFFLTNIESVWKKKSNLNSETREVVYQICIEALNKTYAFYQNSAMIKKDLLVEDK